MGVTAAILLRPGFPALDYHALDQLTRFKPVTSVSYTWSAAEVLDDRAYFGSVDDQGRAGVVAVDTTSREEIWRSDAAGAEKRWRSMTALPGAVALIADPDYDADAGRLVVLDGKTGTKRWEHPFGSTDTALYRNGTMLIVDRKAGQLIGLDLTTGKQRWRNANPDGSTGSTVLDITTSDGLTGPADGDGWPFAAEAGDGRIVQVTNDRSARIIDLATGKPGKSRGNVAYTSDEMVAHNGRLFVEESSTDRLVAYDLKNFDTAEPEVVYTTRDGSDVSGLAPCGDDRICFVETPGYEREKAEVIAYDLEERKVVWRKPAPQVERLIPVGDAVLATTGKSATLFGSDGTPQWSEPGDAVRLDGGNVLRFSDPLSSGAGDQILTGVHVGDAPALIGRIQDVRGGTCSWNTSVLACVADKDFVLARFAG
ncbi:hypothetical protein Are01nite_69170 [Actinoplanes regularis]|nr:hypothetical protein Are01nite_69170 [Actinoplanes regularis]